jgi:hypothetical protein
MQGLIRCAVVAGTLLGCNLGSVDPHDDQPDLDAPLGPSGLIIEWSSTPEAWPSTSSGIELDKAVFHLESLRVIGDSTLGDDPRTTIGNVEMRWENNDRPPSFELKSAPTGLYSQVALVFDRNSSDNNYQFDGEITVNSDKYDLRIRDDRVLSFSIPINERVSPGEMTTIRLGINFWAAIESVNWTSISPQDGKVELEDGDSQMPAFRAALIQSFKAANGGSGVIGSGGL